MLGQFVLEHILENVAAQLMNILPLPKPSDSEEGPLLDLQQLSHHDAQQRVERVNHKTNLLALLSDPLETDLDQIRVALSQEQHTPFDVAFLGLRYDLRRLVDAGLIDLIAVTKQSKPREALVVHHLRLLQH